MIVLNLGLGMNPALVGLLGALPRLTDAFTDPLMGYISDNTRTRWGRRRPFIFGGAIAAGVIFALLWQLPRGQSETFYFVWFLVGSILFYMGYTVFATPWVALGYELTPDYHERTRLMGTQNFIGQLAYVVSPWFLWIMNSGKQFFPDQVTGAAGPGDHHRGGGHRAGHPAGHLPARTHADVATLKRAAAKDAQNPIDGSAQGATWPSSSRASATTLSSGPFLKLCLATFLVFNGFMLISSFQFYVIIYYVCGGDQTAGAKYAGLGRHGGRRLHLRRGRLRHLAGHAHRQAARLLRLHRAVHRRLRAEVGLLQPGPAAGWWSLPAPLMAFGLGGLFTLMPSMVADVVDTDELKTHERREGMFGSIFWWMVKLGLAAALAGGGYLLNATGFDVALGGHQTAPVHHPAAPLRRGHPHARPRPSPSGRWRRFPITEARAHEVRQELERRRGNRGGRCADRRRRPAT